MTGRKVERSTKPPCGIEITPEMIEAAMRVGWVEDYMFEFGLEEGEDRDRMRERIVTLWDAMTAARPN